MDISAWCGCNVPGMILFLTKGAVQLGCSKDMSIHVSTCTILQFQCINSSCMEVVMLIRCVFLHLVVEMDDQVLEE
jgi:hypothetical protein